jgi:asparagine synthase (glutamine-hydrolysing)
MCGIFGLATLSAPEFAPAWRETAQAIAYRGPDAQAFYLAPGQAVQGDPFPEPHSAAPPSDTARLVLNGQQMPADLRSAWPAAPAVFLAHLRLAIIDLQPASDQPLLRGALALAFNGEIYNYIELRDELAALGYRFRTNGDSEVILAAYQQWGRDCVHRLRGMFAFALHDRSAGQLWLVRDRFAIKPLYVALRPGLLAFASQPHVLPLLLRETPQANDRALYNLLAYWCNAFDRDCFYSGVEMLLPGEDLLVDLATLRVERRRYYDLRQLGPGLDMLPATEDTIARFRDVFDEALRIHLRADVPLGVGLSGGLDSSSVLGTIAARHLAGGAELPADAAARGELLPRCLAFSSVFDGDGEVSEGEYVRAVLQHTGIEGRSVTPEFGPLLDRLPELSRVHDGPLTGPSLLVQHSVMGLAKASGVTVVINGQGGDELLCGYLRFIVLYALGQLKRNPLSGLRLTRDMLLHGDPQIRKVIVSALLRRRSGKGDQRRKVLGELLQADRFGQFASAPHPVPYSTDLQRMREQELQVFPIPSLCQNEDRNSMHFSLESRVPLLDHVLVECGLRLPPALLFRKGLAKYVLRAAMRGRVPEKVLWRRNKLGFPAPEQRWLGRLDYRGFRARLTAEQGLCSVFSAKALEPQLWDELDPRQRWLLLAVDAWLGTL